MKYLRSILLGLALCLAPTLALANITIPVAATGATTAKTWEPNAPKVPRLCEIRATGTWGGTTITVQTSSDGGTTWIDTGVSLTANGTDYAYIVAGDLVRVTATGGTGISLTIRIR
jgi:hypothetical protein